MKKQVVLEVFCFECFRYTLPFVKLFYLFPKCKKIE